MKTRWRSRRRRAGLRRRNRKDITCATWLSERGRSGSKKMTTARKKSRKGVMRNDNKFHMNDQNQRKVRRVILVTKK